MKKSKDYASLFRCMIGEWRWLLKYAKRYRLIIVAYILLGMFSAVMSLGTSLATKFLVDAVVQHIGAKLPQYITLVIGLAVFQYVFQALTSWLSAVVGSRANNEIRHDIYSHIVSAAWEDIGLRATPPPFHRALSDSYRRRSRDLCSFSALSASCYTTIKQWQFSL